MPFGKYRGSDLCDLPPEYLDWLQTIELRSPLRESVEREFYRRGNTEQPHDTQPWSSQATGVIRVDPADLGLVAELIERGYKATARVHHPDCGGDADVMRHLNVVAANLRSQLAQIGGAQWC